MSVKDIESVFLSLNIEFVDLKSKMDIIIKKCEDLEFELQNQKKCQLKCSNCSKKFDKLIDLQANFKCEECSKTFRSENQ